MSSRSRIAGAGVSLIAFCLMACSSADDIAPGLDDAGADGTAPQVDVGVPDAGADTGRPDADATNIDDPNNATKDTDCDGLTDAEEFSTIYPGGLKTDPGIADTDGDGILDGVEVGRVSSVDPNCAFAGDQDPTTRTSPVAIDTDGDKLPDGVEDLDRNGRRDANETDPNARKPTATVSPTATRTRTRTASSVRGRRTRSSPTPTAMAFPTASRTLRARIR